MARVAGERSIALGSRAVRARRAAVRGQPRRGCSRSTGAAGIPVFIGTLVSNERDQAPLAVLAGAETDAAGAAKTAYHAAQDAEQAGDYEAAREGYAWARDLDPLRFRAPSLFNEADPQRRRGARRDASSTCTEPSSPRASTAWSAANLLLEHVHPNLDGYFLLADAFFDALVAQRLPGTPEVERAATPRRARRCR